VTKVILRDTGVQACNKVALRRGPCNMTLLLLHEYFGQPPLELDTTSREVLEELECPLYVEFMTPPIPVCHNGRSIHNTCRQKVN